jgi:surface antigen
MQQTIRFAPLLLAVLLAGCSMGPSSSDIQSQPTPIQPTPGSVIAPVAVAPAEPVMVAVNAQTAGDASAFVDAGAYARLSGIDRADAATAQINALNFGRPGAPRNWGKVGTTSGSVTVGPYVQVNNTSCRNFTHVVTIAGAAFTKQGTACKDATGTWSVAG